MCNYWHGGTIECRGDGYMWDADCDGYDPDDHSWPCPACNTAGYLASAKDDAESISYSSGYWGDSTGEDIWNGALSNALRANPQIAPLAIRRMGIVRPIKNHPSDRAGFIECFYDSRQERYLTSRNQREGKYLARRVSINKGN